MVQSLESKKTLWLNLPNPPVTLLSREQEYKNSNKLRFSPTFNHIVFSMVSDQTGFLIKRDYLNH
jgi:hypothetical protein